MYAQILRKLIDTVKDKFGEGACIELCTDGSGVIYHKEHGTYYAEFDGLGELEEILET